MSGAWNTGVEVLSYIYNGVPTNIWLWSTGPIVHSIGVSTRIGEFCHGPGFNRLGSSEDYL